MPRKASLTGGQLLIAASANSPSPTPRGSMDETWDKTVEAFEVIRRLTATDVAVIQARARARTHPLTHTHT